MVVAYLICCSIIILERLGETDENQSRKAEIKAEIRTGYLTSRLHM